MRNLRKTLVLSAAALVLITSCTMEKRVYMPGYHIEWNNGKTTASKQTQVSPKKNETSATAIAPVQNMGLSTLASAKQEAELSLTASSSKKAVVLLSTRKSLSLAKQAAELTKMSRKEIKYLVKTAVKQNKQAASKEGGKSQLVALLLCFFVGYLGIHRFYLGYTTEGIIQLLTGGGCGIWALIDLIRIITGDLKPKSEGYEKTL